MARFSRSRGINYRAVKSVVRSAVRSANRRRKPKTDKMLMVGALAVGAFIFRDKISDLLKGKKGIEGG